MAKNSIIGLVNTLPKKDQCVKNDSYVMILCYSNQHPAHSSVYHVYTVQYNSKFIFLIHFFYLQFE